MVVTDGGIEKAELQLPGLQFSVDRKGGQDALLQMPNLMNDEAGSVGIIRRQVGKTRVDLNAPVNRPTSAGGLVMDAQACPASPDESGSLDRIRAKAIQIVE